LILTHQNQTNLPLNLYNFTLNISESPPLTHPKLDDFCADAYTKVQNLLVEKSKILDFDEHVAKWEALITKLDKSLQKIKGSGRLCTEANNEALRGWFIEFLSQMDLAEPRRNPQRQLSNSRTNANDIPYVYEFPLVNPETPIVPLRPQDFIIFVDVLQPHPAAYVSANEFERFKKRIKTELAAQSAKIYEKLSAQSAKKEAVDENLDLLIRLSTKDIRYP